MKVSTIDHAKSVKVSECESQGKSVSVSVKKVVRNSVVSEVDLPAGQATTNSKLVREQPLTERDREMKADDRKKVERKAHGQKEQNAAGSRQQCVVRSPQKVSAGAEAKPRSTKDQE